MLSLGVPDGSLSISRKSRTIPPLHTLTAAELLFKASSTSDDRSGGVGGGDGVDKVPLSFPTVLRLAPFGDLGERGEISRNLSSLLFDIVFIVTEDEGLSIPFASCNGDNLEVPIGRSDPACSIICGEGINAGESG